MKFSTPLLFATLAFSVADAENRGLRPRGGGGGGGRGGGMNGGGGGKKGPPSPERLQAKIDETCPTFDCNDIEADSLDCTLEERPGRPDFSSMTDAEIEAFKAEMMAKKEEKKEQVMNCACCADISVEELLGGEGKVDGLSFLLESTNSDGIVATEEVSASPANRRVMSYSIGVAVASAFVYAVV
jgi:hypothetical protein